MLRTGAYLALLLGALVIGSWASIEQKHTKSCLNNDIFGHGEEDESRMSCDLEDMRDSAKLMKGYEAFSQREFDRLAAKLLEQIDLDSDGFINRHELKTWLVRSLRSLHDNEVTDRFQEIDTNRDKMITWDEIYVDIFGTESEKEMDAEGRELVAHDREMFEAADSNKDGVLDLTEFYHFEVAEEYPHMVDIALKHSLDHVDINNDGSIDFEEFAVVQSKMKKSHNLRKQFDLDFDKDGDGYLTGAEIVFWLFPNSAHVAEFQVEYLFEEADKQHEGRLPYQAIIDKFGRMLAYDAIDLGMNLRRRSEEEL